MQKTLSQNLQVNESLRFDRNIEKTEADISVFYVNVLKFLYDYPSVKFDKIHQSLSNIRSYKNPNIEVHETVDFEDKYDRCAYNFSYSIIHTMVMYDRFSDMMKDNPSMIKKFVSMKNLRLCILGGGPAFEAVALSKLLSKVIEEFSSNKRPPLQIHLTVIDKCVGWETEAKSIIKFTENQLCTDNNVEIEFTFVEADLTEEFSSNVSKAIKKAHFVIMHKFVSEVNESYIEKKVYGMIDKIIETMSFKSCLFFLDNSGGGVFKKIDKKIDGFPCTSRIYGSRYHCYQLGLDTVEQFSVGMKNVFRRLKCTPQTNVSCSAWLKIRDVVNMKELSSGVSVNISAAVLEDLEREKCKEKEPKVKVKKVLQSFLKEVAKLEEEIETDVVKESDTKLEEESDTNLVKESDEKLKEESDSKVKSKPSIKQCKKKKK